VKLDGRVVGRRVLGDAFVVELSEAGNRGALRFSRPSKWAPAVATRRGLSSLVAPPEHLTGLRRNPNLAIEPYPIVGHGA
jgi:hypothetical protein